ncbi:MAG: hypothetical protein ACLGIO_02985 [Acidimicrobiia bacterium]
MGRGRCLLLVGLVVAAVVALSPSPAAAAHELDELEIIVALNAAGDDKISVVDLTGAPGSYAGLAGDVAISLDRPAGSFRTSHGFEGGYIHPDAKLTQPDGRGGLSYRLDTGKLQVLALREGYEAVVVVVCTPQVRQVVDTLVAPEEAAPYATPGNRCRGWYQDVEAPPIRAVVQLLPDRDRYSSAMLKVAGATAITFALLGLAATALRRGPLHRRSTASWLLSIGAFAVVAPVGWAVVSTLLWLTGPPADPMLLGGGTDGEQVARTLAPGLAFLVPALLPAAVLLNASAKQPPAPGPAVAAAPEVPTWWPTSWWQQWAAQAAPPPPVPPPPVPPPVPPPPPAPGAR